MAVSLRVMAVAVGSVVGASLAAAAMLSPGTGPVAPDVFSIGYSGTQQAFTNPSNGTPFATGGGSITGNVLMQVVSDPSNVYCSGCLDFVLQIENDVSSTANISSLTLPGYAGFQTDVGYDSQSVGSATECGPADNGYCNDMGTGTLGSVSRDGTGSMITFNFAGSGLPPGESSVDFVIETNSRTFAGGTVSAFGSDASSATNIGGIFAPPASTPSATPAPPALLLVSLALLMLVPGIRFIKRHGHQG